MGTAEKPKPYLLKAPPADMDRWVADAKRAGVSFAEHVRAALDAASGQESRPQPWTPAQRVAHRAKKAPRKVPRAARRQSTRAKTTRTEMCVHRRPPGAYCGTCDR